MKPWKDRPREIRNLFNPAFCGMVLLRAIKGFEARRPGGMPFSLTLVVLPLCLHKYSRDAINRGSHSYLTKIIDENPAIVVGFAERVRDLIPYTFEALGYLLQQEAIAIGSHGELATTPRSIRTTIAGTDETRECQRAAGALGKKFAAVGDRVTIYMSLGIRP